MVNSSAGVIQENGSGPAVATRPQLRETALYAPVKAFLERRGYEVKGEVRGCDLVARRGDEPLVVIELKLRLSLALVLQGVDRLALTERVYLAVPRPSSQRRRSRGLPPDSPDVRKLCRRLGLGLVLVGTRSVEIVEEPVPYRPRPAKLRALRLKDEFDRRFGDANMDRPAVPRTAGAGRGSKLADRLPARCRCDRHRGRIRQGDTADPEGGDRALPAAVAVQPCPAAF